MKYNIGFAIQLTVLILLVGCGQKKATFNLRSYSAVHDNVHLMVRPLSARESKKEYGRNALSRGYQPLKIIIENATESYYILHPWYIGLPLSSPIDVAHTLQRETTLICLSMVGVGLVGFEWFMPAALLIPAAAPVGITLAFLNRRIKKRVMSNSIDKGVESIVVPPRGAIKRSIFVASSDFQPQFMFTLFNSMSNQPVQFDVDLEKSEIIASNIA